MIISAFSHIKNIKKKAGRDLKASVERCGTRRVLAVSRAQQQQGYWLGLHLHYANTVKAGSQWRLVALDRCRDTTAIMQISSTADRWNKSTLIRQTKKWHGVGGANIQMLRY